MKKILSLLALLALAATMPSCNDNNDEPQKYAVTVIDGSADPALAVAGETVTLTPAENIADAVFVRWEAVNPVDLNIVDNQFEMPAQEVTVKAVFESTEPQEPVYGFDAISDPVFKAYCEQFDTDDDGILTQAECEAVTTIGMGRNEEDTDPAIESLDGIEMFTNLTSLNIQRNNITELDLSHNTALETLVVSYNPGLTTLNVASNTALKTLACQYCDIDALDVSNHTALTILMCAYNGLSSLNVDNCTALKSLDCHANNLTALNVDDCTLITWLDCMTNHIATLDVSKNLMLPNGGLLKCGRQSVAGQPETPLTLQLTLDPSQAEWWVLLSGAAENANVNVL
jgi:hypothetical protein